MQKILLPTNFEYAIIHHPSSLFLANEEQSWEQSSDNQKAIPSGIWKETADLQTSL